MNEGERLFRQMLDAVDDEREFVLDYYARLKQTKKLRGVLRGEVFCANHCVLMRVFQTPIGAAAYLRQYKNSPDFNEESSTEPGRRANTSDGDRRWKSRAFIISDGWSYGLSCDHLKQRVVELSDFELGSPGKPTRHVVDAGSIHKVA